MTGLHLTRGCENQRFSPSTQGRILTLRTVPLDRPTRPDDSAVRIAIGFVAALTVLRIASLCLNETDLYIDEAQYWTWAQTPDLGYYSKPPLIAWIIAATTALFGDAEWAVRLASPVLHGATALVLIKLGDRLYGGRTGALAGVLYILLPAVALSSTLISTDVPLLLCWALALLFLERLVRLDDWAAAIGFGLAIAVGLNAKYAMAFLPVLALIALAVDGGLRPLTASPRLWVGLGIGLLGMTPNLIWNIRHGFVTFLHTSDNANWQGQLSFAHLGEFLGAQFGVFGPVLFAALLLAVVGRWRSARPRTDRLLLLLSAPVVGAIAVQALLSEANANWAATAYPAATVLVSALLLDGRRDPARKATHALHGLAAAALLIGPLFAADLRLPVIGRPFERVLGWEAFAVAVETEADRLPVRSVVVVRRSDAAALSYYLRNSALPVVVPAPRGLPQDHYQMTRAISAETPAPGLYVVPASYPVPADEGWTVSGPTREIAVSRGVSKHEPMTATPIRW